jgi:ABC-type dipeptide/oligopeptide/nickel transport system permease subunit
MFVEIPPRFAPVIVYATLLIPSAIVFEATPCFWDWARAHPDLGQHALRLIRFYQAAWWFVVFPGGALLVTTS